MTVIAIGRDGFHFRRLCYLSTSFSHLRSQEPGHRSLKRGQGTGLDHWPAVRFGAIWITSLSFSLVRWRLRERGIHCCVETHSSLYARTQNSTVCSFSLVYSTLVYPSLPLCSTEVPGTEWEGKRSHWRKKQYKGITYSLALPLGPGFS